MPLAASAFPIETPPAFLGVSQSLTGKLWRDRLDARGAARALAITQRHQLPELLARWRDDGRPAASFLIGGADGLDAGLSRQAELILSFSPLTWPHQLVRIMLAEQLYRATTILSSHPYHRE